MALVGRRVDQRHRQPGPPGRPEPDICSHVCYGIRHETRYRAAAASWPVGGRPRGSRRKRSRRQPGHWQAAGLGDGLPAGRPVRQHRPGPGDHCPYATTRGWPGSWWPRFTIPTLVSGPVIGAYLDQLRAKRLLFAANQAILAAALTGVVLLAGHAPGTVLIVLGLFAGVTAPVLTGGFSSLVPLVVPAAGLRRANALDAASYNVAGLGRPGSRGGDRRRRPGPAWRSARWPASPPWACCWCWPPPCRAGCGGLNAGTGDRPRLARRGPGVAAGSRGRRAAAAAGRAGAPLHHRRHHPQPAHPGPAAGRACRCWRSGLPTRRRRVPGC